MTTAALLAALVGALWQGPDDGAGQPGAVRFDPGRVDPVTAGAAAG